MFCSEDHNDQRRPSAVSVTGSRPIGWEANVAHVREKSEIYTNVWCGNLKHKEHPEDLVIDYKTWKMSPKNVG